MSDRVRVAVVTAPVAHYRVDFYRRLARLSDLQVTIFAQESLPQTNIKFANEELACSVNEVPFYSLTRPRIFWQKLPFRHLCQQFDVVVIYGNPRFLSSLLLGTLLRFIGKPVIIWGQMHTAGAGRLPEMLRLAWWRLFKSILVYTEDEARSLRNKWKGKAVNSINNGLNLAAIDDAVSAWPSERLARWKRCQGIEDRRLILSVARIVAKNRFDLMIAALPELLSHFPDLLWIVIGDGPQRAQWWSQARAANVCHHMKWIGETYSERDLAPWFLSSEVLVHPGAIGLSMFHAFAYSLPVITHGNAKNQMPEFSALKDGLNSLTFIEGDVRSLNRCLRTLIGNSRLRHRLGENARGIVAHHYNTEIMAERFADAVRLAAAI